MQEKQHNFKKKLTLVHITSGVLAFIFILLFLKNPVYVWVFFSLLALYMISGILILIIYINILGPVQKAYFELLFIAPFLIMAFLFFTKLFDTFFFG